LRLLARAPLMYISLMVDGGRLTVDDQLQTVILFVFGGMCWGICFFSI